MTRSDVMDSTPIGNPGGSEERQRARSAPTAVKTFRQATHSNDRATQCSAISMLENAMFMDGTWNMSLTKYRTKKDDFIKGAKDSKLPRKVRKYYKRQLALIEAYEDLERFQHEDADDHSKPDHETKMALRLSQLSFFANFGLLVIKSIASVKSGSMSMISSVVDSSFDLLSGVIIWYTSQAVQKTDYHLYPFGRRRLEPLAIFLLSVLMSMASLQLIWQSVERALLFAKDLGNVPEFDFITVTITCTVLAIKLSLFLTCYAVKRHLGSSSSSLEVLIQDHRNDTISNTGTLLCGYLGSQQFVKISGEKNVVYVDPIGAALTAVYIFASWWNTGAEQIRFLTGRRAEPEILSQLTWLCLNHNPLILQLDTLKAYYCGTRLLVEVEIVVSENMPLKATHDLRSSLQSKLERLDEVERAIVHVCVKHNKEQQPNKSEVIP